MNSSPSELEHLIHACLNGKLTEAEGIDLNARLRTDPATRDLYLQLADTHACLAVEEHLWVDLPREYSKNAPSGYLAWTGGRTANWVMVAALCLLAIGIGLGVMRSSIGPKPHEEGRQVATFVDLVDCRWVMHSTQVQVGDAIQVGQRVELSSGSASLLFGSGAQVKLIGPAILETLSENSAFLMLGQVSVLAEAPRAKGFTLVTRTAKLVDIGTKFVASAAVDGQSRVDVSVGSVDVRLKDVETVQHLTAGDALCVEPGERQIVTRIESGSGTAAFRFPTIEPPSSRDYADQSRGHATIQVLRGKLGSGVGASGPVSVLIDGKGQSHQDAPEQSVFFANNVNGAFLMDLGKAVSISKINTYSWHQNTTFNSQRHRAVQKYTLFGYAGDNPPSTEDDLIDQGWVRLARVNSDDYFRVADPLDRPAQQACSITAARGTIGRYRYLLWEVESTRGFLTKETNNTFYGEFDVYATESP